jgi:hypothetical protein
MKGIVVNNERMVTGKRPWLGWAVFVPGAATPMRGGRATAAIAALASRRALSPSGLNDGGSNPGEGTA